MYRLPGPGSRIRPPHRGEPVQRWRSGCPTRPWSLSGAPSDAPPALPVTPHVPAGSSAGRAPDPARAPLTPGRPRPPRPSAPAPPPPPRTPTTGRRRFAGWGSGATSRSPAGARDRPAGGSVTSTTPSQGATVRLAVTGVARSLGTEGVSPSPTCLNTPTSSGASGRERGSGDKHATSTARKASGSPGGPPPPGAARSIPISSSPTAFTSSARRGIRSPRALRRARSKPPGSTSTPLDSRCTRPGCNAPCTSPRAWAVATA